MPVKDDLITMVANRMIKGPNYGRLPGTPKQRELFKKRHEKHIAWAISELPRCSAAVVAVAVKCIIRYGEEKVAKFSYMLKNCFFQGTEDPVFLLWKFLQKHQGKDVVLCYQKTVCAAKAFMENKQISDLRPLKQDIFDWDEGWTVPDGFLVNWNPDRMPASYQKETAMV